MQTKQIPTKYCCVFGSARPKETFWGPGAYSWVVQRGPGSPGGATSGLAGCPDGQCGKLLLASLSFNCELFTCVLVVSPPLSYFHIGLSSPASVGTAHRRMHTPGSPFLSDEDNGLAHRPTGWWLDRLSEYDTTNQHRPRVRGNSDVLSRPPCKCNAERDCRQC